MENVERAVAAGTGINWNWYLDYSVVEEDVIKINNHYRMHRFRDNNHPKTDSTFRLETTGRKRFVDAVTINGKYYLVSNPKGIFDYCN